MTLSNFKSLLQEFVKQELDEFSSVGGGAIQGYTLPLGMEPNVPKETKKKKKRKKKKEN